MDVRIRAGSAVIAERVEDHLVCYSNIVGGISPKLMQDFFPNEIIPETLLTLLDEIFSAKDDKEWTLASMKLIKIMPEEMFISLYNAGVIVSMGKNIYCVKVKME